MIDFIKCAVYNPEIIDYFRSHRLLEWQSSEDKFNRFDAEVIKTKIVRSYDGFTFIFRSDWLEITFKPHYRRNRGLHNADDFSMNDCIRQIMDFKNIFGVNLFYFPVVNLEYSLNILPLIDIKELMLLIFAHCRNLFYNDRDLPFSKRSYRADKFGKANEYKSIKCYAKGLQKGNPCAPDTLRFEVNSKMRKFIRTLGIETLEDLLNPVIYSNLAESIIMEFEHILLIDKTADLTRLPDNEQKKMESYLNPLYWHKILSGHRNLFSTEKKKYYSLLNQTGHHLKLQLCELIQSKAYELTGVNVQIPQ